MKEYPATYKVRREKQHGDITKYVLDVMFPHTGFYDDYAEYQRFLAPATPGQIVLFSTFWYGSEVSNGAHQQFFFNPTGMVWKEALDGLKALGSEDYYLILRDACALFPNGEPPREREPRIEMLEEVVDLDALAEIDDRWLNCEEDIYSLVVAYIESHPDEFFLDEP